MFRVMLVAALLASATLAVLAGTAGRVVPLAAGGRVTDAAGEPVGGARAFAVRNYMAAMRDLREHAMADSATDETFRLPPPPGDAKRRGHTSDTAFLVAAPGRPPVPMRKLADPVVLAEPAAGGALVVRVVRDGRPVDGATVALAPRYWGWPFEYQGLVAGSPEPTQQFMAVVFPIRTTDARGEATFADLLPGVYDARAYLKLASQNVSFSPAWRIPTKLRMPMNDSYGLALAAGERRSHTVALREDGPFTRPADYRPYGRSAPWARATRRGALALDDGPPPRESRGVGPIDWAEHAGTVVMPDGKTPALGAAVLVFGPSTWGPEQDAVANARGAFVTGPREVDGLWPKPEPPGSPDGLALLAWLPGSCGGVVVPLPAGDKKHPPVRIILPAPVTLRGRVTVDGRPLRPALGTARVVAEHRGRGKLDAFLTVETTAEPDGAFELRGLTPGGDYRVRAVLDESFQSRELRQRVVPATDPAAVTLDVERGE